ncbi:DNA cytosine methyltransferase [Thermoactinomyces daqus]|uniref:DNA cytosine methyltransferase n=1 Tax=Thermoactinomyces daqus TaxID=1329516 RepID=UPI00051A1D9C|nr:DNA cytosine methyltransferase [Thermoactinomyces daqus]
MRILDLFSGIGGFSLAAHWAGMETAAFCEIEPFCQKVLRKNFPGVPIYNDVRTITKEQLERDGVIRPKHGDAYGSSKTRARVTLADSTGELPHGSRKTWNRRDEHTNSSEVMANTDCAGREKRHLAAVTEGTGFSTRGTDPRRAERPAQSQLGRVPDGFSVGLDGHRWPAGLGQTQYEWEPPRVTEGVKRRKDRLKALGNAIVPQVAYQILKAIMEVEKHELASRIHTN